MRGNMTQVHEEFTCLENFCVFTEKLTLAHRCLLYSVCCVQHFTTSLSFSIPFSTQSTVFSGSLTAVVSVPCDLFCSAQSQK